jgi:gliding motility-associated-like protein
LNDATIAKPIATPLESINYTVSVTNAEGCEASDSVFIKVNPVLDIYMPTGFTPNNDGKNDIIRPFIGPEFKLKQFSIYNRWGGIVFSTSEIGEGWDGTIRSISQSSGIYVWLIKAEDKQRKTIVKKGTLMLIR